MNTSIVMPQLGLTMTEGTVSEWLKKPGDQVRKDEPLFVVSTDKADMEVESPVEGTLVQIIIRAGQMVPVGTILAYIAGQGEDALVLGQAETSSKTEPRLQMEQQQARVPEEASPESLSQLAAPRVSASPRAKRLAEKLGVNLSSVKGSGQGGRVVEEDVRRAARDVPWQVVDADRRRRQLIADKMTLSVQTIPHFALSVQVNAEKLLSLYESLKDPVRSMAGLKLTLTDLLLRALALALRSAPELNATWRDNAAHPQTSIDLGLAVATDQGVVAPVMRYVDRMKLEDLVARRTQLIEKARNGRLAISDLDGGVGTLSNLGMYRVDHFQAIINRGQSFVLAVGRICKRPWVESTLVIRPTVNLNLSVDHRVADGVTGAVFLQKIADLIENPNQLFTNHDSQDTDENPGASGAGFLST